MNEPENLHFSQLGETILTQHLTDADQTDENRPHPNDPIYIHTVNLSNLMIKLNLSLDSPTKLSEKHQKEMLKHISSILNQLDFIDKSPSPKIGPGTSVFESYRILCFALLVLNRNKQPENNDIQKELNELQTKYNELLENSSDPNSVSSLLQSVHSTHSKLERENIDLQSRVYDLEEQLKEKQSDNSEIVFQLIDEFDLPNGTKSDNLIRNLKQYIQTQVQEQTAQIKTKLEKRTKEVQDLILLTQDSNGSEKTSFDVQKVVDKERKINDGLQWQLQQLTNHVDNLQNQINELTLSNSNLEAENTSLKQENEAIKAENEQKFRYINTLKEKNNNLAQNLSEKASSDETTSAKMFVLETDLASTQVQNKDLNDKLNKTKDKLHTLKKKLLDADQVSKEKDIAIEAIQMKYDQISIQLDDAKNASSPEREASLIADIKFRDAQINNLTIALNELSTQIEQMSEEIQQESNHKNQLFELIQKQNSALAISDAQIKALQNERDNALTNQKQFNGFQVDECIHQEVIDELDQFINEKYNQSKLTQHINSILASPQFSPIDKVLNSFNAAMDYIQFVQNAETPSEAQSKEILLLKTQKTILVNALSNTLKFLDQVANSGEIQNWMVDTSFQEADVRSLLLAQCGRVESFIKQHGISTDNVIDVVERFVEFPSYANQVIDQLEDPNEILALLQTAVQSNEILRKYSDQLQEHCQNVISDMKSMKHELIQLQDTLNEQIEESTMSLTDELLEEREARSRAESVIQSIQNKLRKASATEDVIRCLNMLNDNQEENEEETKENPETYIRRLEKRLHKAYKERDSVIEELNIVTTQSKKAINKYKKQIEEINHSADQQNEQSNTQITELRERIEALSSEAEQTRDSLMKAIEENKQINETLRQQTDYIARIDQLKENELQALENDLTTKLQEEINSKQTEIEELQKKVDTIDEQIAQEAKKIRRETKADFKKLQAELAQQTTRASELRDHYEPLLADLRAKIQEARETETEAREISKRSETQVQSFKSELMTARIDTKMAVMKLSALEEKLKRDQSLLETQYKMKMLGVETNYQTELENIKTEHAMNIHKFLVSICEKFKEFVDFNQPISQETVLAMLSRVMSSYQKNALDLCTYGDIEAEVSEVRSLLDLSEETNLVQAINCLIKEAREYQKNKKQIEGDKQEAYNLLKQTKKNFNIEQALQAWEQWAKRVHTLITDSFSATKTDKELQAALEEALLGSIGQRKNWRKLEILRVEKSILNSMIPKQQKTRKQIPSMNSISTVFIAVYRMQKLAGHMHCAISIPKKRQEKPVERAEVGEPQTPTKKKFPIFSIV